MDIRFVRLTFAIERKLSEDIFKIGFYQVVPVAV